MIRVTVELVPGGVGEPQVLGTCIIYNDRDDTRRNHARGSYGWRMISKSHRVTRESRVDTRIVNYPRLNLPVWCLVKRVLEQAGYQ